MFFRIARLVDYAQHAETHRGETAIFEKTSIKDGVFSVKDLVFYAPNDDKRKILNGITFDISSSKPMLISGVSGVGKTSVLRLLRQLWAPTRGQLERFVSYDEIIFLPQNTYLPIGNLSLKKQLHFPSTGDDSSFDETKIVSILEALSLSRLLALCGNLEDKVDFEWNEILSPGEQQRLSIARVLLRKPKVVILDEATSGLSEDMEMTVYDLLKKNEICYVSVGHRSTLPEYHKVQLHIKGPDTWELKNIDSNHF